MSQNSGLNQINMTEETSQKTDLKSLTKSELTAFCSEIGLQSYRADQMYQWLYQKGISEFSEMTNLSKDLRAKLPKIATLNRLSLVNRQQSKDGTIKYLFELTNGGRIESVLIPDFDDSGNPKRLTVCVSSQVGCVFGCSFCATGKMGFFDHLTHGQIVDQVQFIHREAKYIYNRGITNVVYMGMGEPLHNYKSVMTSADIITDELGLDLSPKRITISTVGLTKQIKKWADERLPYNLAISLHAADDQKRNQIMPVNESMNLEALKEAVVYYFNTMHKPITYEYLLFRDFNDHIEDAHKLSSIVHWAPSKVNIIMYNPVEGVTLSGASETKLDQFMQTLVEQDVTATVRRSRGDDIDAGCGQLAIRDGKKRGKTITNK